MNQKNYTKLLCSLLCASFLITDLVGSDATNTNDPAMNDVTATVPGGGAASGSSAEDINKYFDDESGKSREEKERKREEEKDNYEWAKKYAQMVARYFASDDIYQITRKQLLEYIEKHIAIFDETEIVKGDLEFKLGAVNAVLERYKSEAFNDMVNAVVKKFEQQNRYRVDQFSEIKDIVYSDKFSSKRQDMLRNDPTLRRDMIVDITGKLKKARWEKKYGKIIADYFEKNKIYSITYKNLKDYQDNHRAIPEQAFDEITKQEQLDIINRLLQEPSTIKRLHRELFKFFTTKEEQKNLDKKKQEQYDRYLNQIFEDFKAEGKRKLRGFSEILEKAKNMIPAFPASFIAKLEMMTDREKGNLFLQMDMMLPNEKKIARALELAHQVEKENKRQGRGFEDRERREHREKVARVGRALELAREVSTNENKGMRAPENSENFENS